ncbi:MAG: ABC transporter permease [Rhodothermales bacterium]
MFQNYLKTGLRALFRSKTHATINIAGLALGILCALIIFQLARFELTFNQDIAEAEQIHRIYRDVIEFGEQEYGAGLPYPIFEAFRTDFPEVDQITIVDDNFGNPVLTVERSNGQQFKFEETDKGGAFVDPVFFDIFPRTWLRGNPETAMQQPYSIVLSETLAQKYFGDDDPMGKTIQFNTGFDLTVTGIINDAPKNQDLQLDYLITANLGEQSRHLDGSWGSISSGVQGYVKLPPTMTQVAMEAQLEEFVVRHRGEEVAELLSFRLQPLLEMHYDTRLSSPGYTTSEATILAFGILGIFLLLTAGINFINLNTVLVFKRAKEVGVRKVLGGTPQQIMNYFMAETALVTFLAMVLAVALALPGMELVKSFLGSEATMDLADPLVWLALFGMGTVLTIVSGLYPAFLMSRLQPALVVKPGGMQKPGGFMSLRRTLIVFQFAISQVLIIATVVTAYQLQHLRNASLGYDTSAIVEFYIPDRDASVLETLRNELQRSSAIENVTFSNSGATSGSTWGTNFHYEVGDQRLEHNTQVKLVDTGYLDTYKMNLLVGRNFVHADSVTGVIINESMVKLMGLQEPQEALDIPIEFWGNPAVPVIGVIKDFHTNSLHQPIEPTLLAAMPDRKYYGGVKINMQRMDEALADVEAAWTAAFPAFVYDYGFLDERVQRFYEDERSMNQLIQIFAGIAILIGCIGLFGLISYTTAQRSKEVGVRKVLGASVPQIVGLFTREFVVLVGVGFVVSAPIAYYVMSEWLSNFAYQVNMGVGVFLFSLTVSLAIALGTVGYQTYRAATANPVQAIRAE